MKGKITANPEYECLKCCDLTRTIDGRSATQVEVDGTQLKIVYFYLYIGDMLSPGGGGCEQSFITIWCIALE